MDVYEMDAIDKNTLIARMDELTSEEGGLHVRKSEIAYDLEGNGAKKVPFECVPDLYASMDEVLAKVAVEQRKALLHLAIQEITSEMVGK